MLWHVTVLHPLNDWWHSAVQTDDIWFSTHQLMGVLGCFLFLAITGNADTTICTSFVWHVFSSLGYIPRRVIVGSHGNFNFLRNCQHFSTCSRAFVSIRLFDHSHPSKCKGVVHCGFDLHFPNDKWCSASFHVFTGHLSIPSGKKFNPSAHLNTELFVFLLLSCKSSVRVPYILRIVDSYQKYD